MQVIGSKISAPSEQAFDAASLKQLSVAIYVQDLSPGDVERQCLVLARELDARDVAVTLIVHRLAGALMPLLPDGVPVVALNGKRTLSDVLALRRYLRDARPDVLVANVDHINVAASIAKALAGTRTKLVICQHNPLVGYHTTVRWKHRVLPWCYRAFSPFIAQAVAVSTGVARELSQLAGLPAGKISTIFNAVIGGDFEQRAAQPVDHPWLTDKDRPVYVTAGRLVESNDHRTLLRAFATHLRTRPGRLMILGGGPRLDELRGLAGELGIAEHVEFAGAVANPLPFIKAADAFVLSSLSQEFGNVLVEAMGCGTRVISTDCPHGPADILDGGRYGILVPPRNPEALAPAFGRIIDDAGRWPPDLLRARAATFSYDSCVDSYASLFKRLAAVSPNGSVRPGAPSAARTTPTRPAAAR